MKQNGTQRIGYFDGQLLTARDLQDDAAFESRLRGLHLRAMHNTWGVALGYAVARVTAPSGERQAVEVGPGIAYDCYGREIISARTINAGPPPAPTHSQADLWYFDLVISYRDSEQAAGPRQELCAAGAFNPLEERPRWRWRFAGDAVEPAAGSQARPDELRLGEEVPLARFTVSAGGAISQPDFSVRRNAQGLVRPHIYAGEADGRLTFSNTQAAFTMTVDTAPAGFNQTPFYAARVTLPELLSEAGEGKLPELRGLQGPFVTIRSPQRDRFQLDLRFGVATGEDSEPTTPEAKEALAFIRIWQEQASQLAVQVDWVGVEPNGGCAPPIQLAFLYLYFTPVVASLSAIGSLATFDFISGGS